MFYKTIIILVVIFMLIRIYEYYYKKRSSLNNKVKPNKINSIKKDNIKDGDFEEIK